MARNPESSRVPSLVGALPIVGDLAKSADAQARWLQELVEQNARLVGQFPATMKTFNDSLERFNQTIGRLDRAVTTIEAATRNLTDLQRQVERILALLGELPGAGLVRRVAGSGRGDESPTRPRPATKD